MTATAATVTRRGDTGNDRDDREREGRDDKCHKPFHLKSSRSGAPSSMAADPGNDQTMRPAVLTNEQGAVVDGGWLKRGGRPGA